MRPRKIDFAGRDWSAHAQDHWLDFAGNPNLPDYLRIVFVAYGRHAGNGHAKLERGELAYFLVRKDGTLPDRRNVRHSIDTAVRLGYLVDGSRALCLVVSSHQVQGGRGDPDRRCDRDHTIRRRPAAPRSNDVTGSRPFGRNDVNGSGPSSTNDVTGSRRSVLTPSISLLPSHNVTAPEGPDPDERQAGA